jgi:hypothetical protein
MRCSPRYGVGSGPAAAVSEASLSWCRSASPPESSKNQIGPEDSHQPIKEPASKNVTMGTRRHISYSVVETLSHRVCSDPLWKSRLQDGHFQTINSGLEARLASFLFGDVRFVPKADIGRLIRSPPSALANVHGSFGTCVRFPTPKSLLSAADRATTSPICQKGLQIVSTIVIRNFLIGFDST